MAGGNNETFRNHPTEFLRTHQLMTSPQVFTPAQNLTTGAMQIDLVSIDPKNPQFIRLENFAMRTHRRSARAVNACVLPAVVNNTATVPIGAGADYFFTSDLSGCLFAVYGPNALNVTAEHVNVRDAAAALVPIVPRAQAIIAAAYGFYKILSPEPIPGANTAHVKTYAMNSSVIGVKLGGSWTFHYKPGMNTVATL